MQSNVDLCPRCSRSNSYRPPLLPSPVTYSPSCAIFHSCSSAEQILRFSIISNESSRSDYPPDTSDFGRAIAKFRGARSRVGSRPFSHGTFARFLLRRRNFRGISIGNCGTLFEKRFVFRYSTACRESNCKINILEN